MGDTALCGWAAVRSANRALSDPHPAVWTEPGATGREGPARAQRTRDVTGPRGECPDKTYSGQAARTRFIAERGRAVEIRYGVLVGGLERLPAAPRADW
jgi:hypothetical protein